MNSLLLSAVMLGSALAIPNPRPQGVFAPPTCIEGQGQIKYTIDSSEIIQGDIVVGDYTVGGGSSLTKGSSFTTSVTITKGVDLGISKIVGAGLSYSVSTTEAKGTSSSATVPCPPGPWKCALAIYPSIVKVNGQKLPLHPGESTVAPCDEVDVPYEVLLPETGADGAKAYVDICACKNFDHWSDAGAPSIVCDQCPE